MVTEMNLTEITKQKYRLRFPVLTAVQKLSSYFAVWNNTEARLQYTAFGQLKTRTVGEHICPQYLRTAHLS